MTSCMAGDGQPSSKQRVDAKAAQQRQRSRGEAADAEATEDTDAAPARRGDALAGKRWVRVLG